MIDLYTWPTPNGHKVHIFLEETGLPYKVHAVNIGQGDQFKPSFLKISPNNKIPAIVDADGPGGRPISVVESGAILIYLAEKTGLFMPRDPAARVAVLEWLMFQVGGFGPMPGQVHHFIALGDESNRRYGLERFSAETRRLYGVMDRRLAEQEYFAGELSIADFAILGWVWRHERHRVDLADFPHVQRWYQNLLARPAVARGFAVPMRRA
jgi:GST-like protein